MADNGLNFLHNISENPDYGFSGINISYEEAENRLQYLCEFYRSISNIHKSKKKRAPDELTFDENGQIQAPTKKIKLSKFVIPKDEDGEIVYPIVINNSLTILNLGYIETERSAYHSGRNIFPIGFKSIREHSSMFRAKERMQYLCEILDGGMKPLFKVTPMQDSEQLEDQSILRESCTGC